MEDDEQVIDEADQVVRIDPDDLHREFLEVSSQLSWWGRQYAAAQVAFMRAELALKRLRRRVYLDLRAGKEKGDTEASLDARVELADTVIELGDVLLGRAGRELDLKATVEALRTKRDMLVSLGAHVRAELKGDPLVRRANREG